MCNWMQNDKSQREAQQKLQQAQYAMNLLLDGQVDNPIEIASLTAMAAAGGFEKMNQDLYKAGLYDKHYQTNYGGGIKDTLANGLGRVIQQDNPVTLSPCQQGQLTIDNYNAQTGRINLDTNKYSVQTGRMNANTNAYKAETERLNYGLNTEKFNYQQQKDSQWNPISINKMVGSVKVTRFYNSSTEKIKERPLGP